MLHTLTDDGHMNWRCDKCGSNRSAHVSHPLVEHPVQDEIETHLEGSDVDDQGVTHLKIAAIKTGVNVHHGTIALPPCDCGARMYLVSHFTDEEFAAIARVDADGNETTASVEAAQRHRDLAEHMQRLGKAPDNLRRGARV